MDNILIANKPDFSIADYEAAVGRKDESDKSLISEAIKRRLIQRYISPCEVEENKNGFNIMANCCLLIETYESFYRGWPKSPTSSEAFCKFFNRSSNFLDFTGNDLPTEFYKNIRCGILHQGETTSGWRIRRDQSSKLNLTDKIIDANLFRDALKLEIEDYFDSLKTKDWSSPEWMMLFKKMNAIIKNCKK